MSQNPQKITAKGFTYITKISSSELKIRGHNELCLAVYRPYRPTMLRNMRIFGTHVLEYTELLFEQDMR